VKNSEQKGKYLIITSRILLKTSPQIFPWGISPDLTTAFTQIEFSVEQAKGMVLKVFNSPYYYQYF